MNNSTEKTEIPKGFALNSQGHMVPVKLIKPIDRARDNLVNNLIDAAKAVREPMVQFRQDAEDTIIEFINLSGSQYDAKLGGKKGNVQLMSYDGLRMVRRTYGETMYFDERIQAAKSLIDECIVEWSKGSNINVKSLVNHAFQVDKQGQISRDRVLGLKKLDINDKKWRQAMQAITDSIQTSGRKSYLTFYERPSLDADWVRITMDIASL